MLQPSTCDPVTVHGVGVVRNGALGQTATTLPATEPPAWALLSKTLPFDHMSPVTRVVELPWNVSEFPAPPAQPLGASVWIAAPLVPVLRARAVAVAPTVIAPAPSTCITVTGT